MQGLREVPAPDLDDPRFRQYWAGAAELKLMLPRCESCRLVNWPPRFQCTHCGRDHFVWDEYRPVGTLYSWTTVGHATAPGYSDVPYSVGIVSLDGVGVRLMGQIVGVEPQNLTMNMELVARFTPAGRDDEFTVIQWEPRMMDNSTSPEGV